MRRDVFQAIADPIRREIIHLIAHQPLTPNELAESFHVTRQAISKHIKILTECGLVEINQQGRERYCLVKPEKMDDLFDWLNEFRKIWDARFERLDNILDQLKHPTTE